MSPTLKLFGWMIVGGVACLCYAGCAAPVDDGTEDGAASEEVGEATSDLTIASYFATGPCEWYTQVVVDPNACAGYYTKTSCRNKVNQVCADPNLSCRGHLEVSSPNSTTVTAVCDCQPKDPT